MTQYPFADPVAGENHHDCDPDVLDDSDERVSVLATGHKIADEREQTHSEDNQSHHRLLDRQKSDREHKKHRDQESGQKIG